MKGKYATLGQNRRAAELGQLRKDFTVANTNELEIKES